MEYTPIKPDEYFIIQIPTPSPPEWRRQRASFMFPLFLSCFFIHAYMCFCFSLLFCFVYFFACIDKNAHLLKSLVQVPLRASVTGLFRLLLLRCFLFCQNASLQVNSDLKTSSPWGRLQHSLLSSFKHNLFHSLLSGPIPPPPPPTLLFPAPPRSLQCVVLFPASQAPVAAWAQLVKGNTGAWSSSPSLCTAF